MPKDKMVVVRVRMPKSWVVKLKRKAAKIPYSDKSKEIRKAIRKVI